MQAKKKGLLRAPQQQRKRQHEINERNLANCLFIFNEQVQHLLNIK